MQLVFERSKSHIFKNQPSLSCSFTCHGRLTTAPRLVEFVSLQKFKGYFNPSKVTEVAVVVVACTQADGINLPLLVIEYLEKSQLVCLIATCK